MEEKEVYEVEFRETLSRVVKVVAYSEDEAYVIAEELYNNEDVVLDSDDFVGFDITTELAEDQRLASAIRTLQANDPNGSWEEIDTKEELVETLVTALEEGRDKDIERFYKDILGGIE